jgi:general secretion pathway protein D
MGEPRLLSQVESLLQTLDVRQPQVMLEVLIISLSDSQTLDLGVELEKLSFGETSTRLASLFGLSTRGPGGTVDAGNGLGLTGVVLNPGDFSVVLRALQTLNKGKSLSMPRLLVTNNQQGTLDSILEQPYASTNASNTVTTTSFGGSKPAGTQITLKPQIAGGGEGDHLLLDYNVSLSAFVGAAANSSLPPPRQENKLQSIASLPDGYTVVVGGIELDAEGKATNQVPGLGQIPVLGEAFKSRSNNASRSRFYVFIRANILRARGFEDLKYISETEAPNAGIDDGWPAVEPRVMR